MIFETPNKYLIALICTKDWDNAADKADSSCLGSSVDNGFDDFTAGYDLAIKTALSGGRVYMFENYDEIIFFIAKDEVELAKRIEALEDDVGRDDEDEDEEDED